MVPSNTPGGISQLQRINIAAPSSTLSNSISTIESTDSQVVLTNGGNHHQAGLGHLETQFQGNNPTDTSSSIGIELEQNEINSQIDENQIQDETGDDEEEGAQVADCEEEEEEEEEPLYVNAKQYNRILKRRIARAKLENDGRIPKIRQVPYGSP